MGRLKKYLRNNLKSMNNQETEKLIKKYESILNNQSIFVVRTDLNGYYTYANQHFCNIFAKPREDIIGLHGYIHIIPEDHDLCEITVKKCFANPNRSYSVTLRKPLPDGSIIHSDWEFSVVRNESGEMIEIQCVGKDTTERFKLQEEISESRKEFISYFDSNPVPTFVWSKMENDFLLVELNSAAKYSSEIQIRNGSPTFFKSNYKKLPELIQKVEIAHKNKVKTDYEAWFFNKDNKLECFNYKIIPRFDEKLIVYVERLTNEKRAILELDRTKDLLEQANAITRVGIWEYDFRSKRIYYSEIVKNIFELDDDESINSMEDTIPYFKAGFYRNSIIEAYQRVLSFGTPFDMESQITTRKGRQIWIRVVGEAEFFQDRVVRIYGIIRDIDEKKKTELATKHLAAIVESSVDAIIGKDLNSMVTSWNKGAEKIFGYSAKEMIGNSILKIFPADRYTEELIIIEEIKKGKSIQAFETKRKRKDGSLIDVSITVSPIKNDKDIIVGISNISQDISERKMTEVLLTESNEKFQSLVESLSDVIYSLDVFGNIIYASPNWFTNLGYSPEDLIGKHFSFLIDPDDLDICNLAITEILEFKKKRNIDIRLVHKDGRDIWHSVSGAPQFGANNEIVAIVGIAHNISELKEKENEILEAKKKAESASKTKSEFIANVSHEIRTPLHGIIGFTELLLKTELKDTQYEYMKSVSRSANSLFELINDILDYSKIEEGKIELNPESIVLSDFLYGLVDMIKYSCIKKKIDFYIVNQVEDIHTIKIDPLRLRQVLVNLLSNAVKFTHKGEIELKIKRDTTINDKLVLLFTVSDSGIGIAESSKKKIFEAFTQEDSSTTKRYGGTGLGLTISNKLLHLMNSMLLLESEQGKGSTFYFQLPIEEVSYQKNERSNELLNTRKSNSILLFDENEKRGMIHWNIFSNAGLEVTYFRDKETFLNEMKVNNILTCVILSIGFWDESAKKNVNEAIHICSKKENIFGISLLSYDLPNLDELPKGKIERCISIPLDPREVKRFIEYEIENPHQNKSTGNSSVKQFYLADSVRILLVEDSEINEFLVTAIIDSALPNSKLMIARNGIEALEVFAKEDFSIILMDLQMPEMNGYEATARMRNMDKGRTIPIIGISAGTQKEEISKCLEAGMDDFLGKPFNQEEFLGIFKKWIK